MYNCAITHARLEIRSVLFIFFILRSFQLEVAVTLSPVVEND